MNTSDASMGAHFNGNLWKDFALGVDPVDQYKSIEGLVKIDFVICFCSMQGWKCHMLSAILCILSWSCRCECQLLALLLIPVVADPTSHMEFAPNMTSTVVLQSDSLRPKPIRSWRIFMGHLWGDLFLHLHHFSVSGAFPYFFLDGNGKLVYFLCSTSYITFFILLPVVIYEAVISLYLYDVIGWDGL